MAEFLLQHQNKTFIKRVSTALRLKHVTLIERPISATLNPPQSRRGPIAVRRS